MSCCLKWFKYKKKKIKSIFLNGIILLLKLALQTVLVCYVLVNLRKPISDLFAELLDVEVRSADIINQFLTARGPCKSVNLRGSLAKVLSFIKIGKRLPK